MTGNAAILDEHLRVMSLGYPLSISDDRKWLVVHGFRLPPGYNRTHTDVLIEIPEDYPLTPPGVATVLCVAPDLLYQGHVLQSYDVRDVPGLGRWGYLCYRGIRWRPCSDNLVTLTEMLRVDLTNPSARPVEAE